MGGFDFKKTNTSKELIIIMGDNKGKVNLIFYTIRLRKKHTSRSKYLKFSDVKKDITYIDFLKNFLGHINNITFQTEDESRIFDLERLDLTHYKDGILAGYVSKGVKLGGGAAIKEKKGKKSSLVKKLDKDQYPTHEFFFTIYQPVKHEDLAILVVQSYKSFGYKDIFEKAFNSYSEGKLPEDTMIDMNVLSNPNLFDKIMEQASFKKLKYRRYSLPKIFDKILDSEPSDVDRNFYEIEFSISANKNRVLPFGKKIKKLADNNTTLIEIAEDEDISFDEVYAEVIIGGNRRIINISKPNNFGAVYDITDDINLDIDGKPEFNSIFKVVKNILDKDIMENIKF